MRGGGASCLAVSTPPLSLPPSASSCSSRRHTPPPSQPIPLSISLLCRISLPPSPSSRLATLCHRSSSTEADDEEEQQKAAAEGTMLLHKDAVPADYSPAACRPVDETAFLDPKSKFLTLPTVLTLARVAAIPFLLCAFYSNEWWATPAVPIIFVLAAVTDWLDGFLARKMGSNSTFGAFLDPVADKLMVATTLVLLCTKPLNASWAAAFPWLIPLPSTAIIGREITMSAVREWAASQGGELQAAVAVNNLGKWKTASQLVALTALLATRNASSEIGIAHLMIGFGIILLYISAGLALLSLAAYMKAVWGSLIK